MLRLLRCWRYPFSVNSLFEKPLVFFLVISAGLIGLSYALATNQLWNGLELGNAGLWEEYCERNRWDLLIRQQVNSWSNLIYLFLGLIVLKFAQVDARVPGDFSPPGPMNAVTRFPMFSVLFGLSLISLFAGSFFYHASLTRIGQHFDMAATYWVLLCLCGYVIYRVYIATGGRQYFKNQWLFVLLILGADLLFFFFKWQINSFYVLPGMIGFVLLGGLLFLIFSSGKFHVPTGISSLVAIGAAVFFRQMDVQKVLCKPDSLFQGHALWHLLTGLAAFLSYTFFRSEEEPVTRQ